MSVLECSRKGCDNIMCDRYSTEYGYICDECFEELVRRGPEANIEEFMSSGKRPNRKEAAEARFSVEFPRK